MIWRIQQFIAIVLMAGYFGSFVWRKNKAAGLLAGWILISGSLVCWNPQIISSLIDMRLRVTSAKGIAFIALLLFFIISLSRRHISKLFLFFDFIIVSEVVLLLAFGSGLLDADSMDAAFVAVIYPILWRKCGWYRILQAMVPLAMLFIPRHGNTMFVVMAAEFIALAGTVHLAFLPLAPLVGLLAYAFNKTHFLVSADRVPNWKLFMGWLFENNKEWLGTGTSTFKWIGPLLQNKETDLFLWMHNDWLQLIFEQGILGMVITLFLIAQCLIKSKNRPWLFASSIGYMACMITQFPLRYFVGQLLAVTLIRASLEDV